MKVRTKVSTATINYDPKSQAPGPSLSGATEMRYKGKKVDTWLTQEDAYDGGERLHVRALEIKDVFDRFDNSDDLRTFDFDSREGHVQLQDASFHRHHYSDSGFSTDYTRQIDGRTYTVGGMADTVSISGYKNSDGDIFATIKETRENAHNDGLRTDVVRIDGETNEINWVYSKGDYRSSQTLSYEADGTRTYTESKLQASDKNYSYEQTSTVDGVSNTRIKAKNPRKKPGMGEYDAVRGTTPKHYWKGENAKDAYRKEQHRIRERREAWAHWKKEAQENPHIRNPYTRSQSLDENEYLFG